MFFTPTAHPLFTREVRGQGQEQISGPGADVELLQPVRRTAAAPRKGLKDILTAANVHLLVWFFW